MVSVGASVVHDIDAAASVVELAFFHVFAGIAVVVVTVVAAAAVPAAEAAPLASPILQSHPVCVGAQVCSTSSPSTVSSASGEGLDAPQCMNNACMQMLSRWRGRAQYLRQSLQKQLCIHVGQG